MLVVVRVFIQPIEKTRARAKPMQTERGAGGSSTIETNQQKVRTKEPTAAAVVAVVVGNQRTREPTKERW